MFYRPNFCANCGEKVERAEWGLLTSRRFCPVCESEFKGQDLIPRAVVAVALLVGIFGTGAYMRSGPSTPAPVAFRQPVKATGPGSQPTVGPRAGSAPTATNPPDVGRSGAQPQESIRPAQAAPSVPRYEAADDTYICGAETKKGTPCSRRVKGNIRCYQHKGMPAMLPADKLKVS